MVVAIYADSAHHVGRGQASYFWVRARPEGPKPKAQRADSGGRVLGKGQPAPSPPARGSGALPSGVRIAKPRPSR